MDDEMDETPPPETTSYTSRQIIGAIAGLLIMGGAGAAWHYWHIDGFLAFLVAGGGFALLSRSLGFNLDL